MGTHCSSELHRGHIQVKKTTTMKLLLLTALAAVAMAEPEADAWHGYYGYGYHPGFYGYGHQQAWPAAAGPGFSSTCFGCRGKRSVEEEAAPAEAEVAPVAKVAPVHYGFPFYGYGLPAIYNNPTLQWPGFKAPGVEVTSWGARGKRSADAEPGYGYYGFPYRPYGLYGYNNPALQWPGYKGPGFER